MHTGKLSNIADAVKSASVEFQRLDCQMLVATFQRQLKLRLLQIQVEYLIECTHHPDATAATTNHDIVAALEMSLSQFPELQSEVIENLEQETKSMVGFLSASSRVVDPMIPESVKDRFRIDELLGRGGMGTVYRAFDRLESRQVALKTFNYSSPTQLYRLKGEFRSLADIRHSNVVQFFEMFVESAAACYSMELIEGDSFQNVLKQNKRDEYGFGAKSRKLFLGVASGLSAVHDAGLMHRDLKPSNVVVNSSGRPVILDFGLAAQLNHEGKHETIQAAVRGTLQYMSPEQSRGDAIGPASDWYSFGVMLFRSLTGHLPTQGQNISDFVQKINEPKSDTIESALSQFPDDLANLCEGLLRIQPEDRLGYEDVVSVLKPANGSVADAAAIPCVDALGLKSVRNGNVFGRGQELKRINRILENDERSPLVVEVIGNSGSGKSVFVDSFFQQFAGKRGFLTLRGNCYLQEAVRYQGFDALIDEMSRVFQGYSSVNVASFLPRDVTSLVQMFPVLRQVGAINTLAKIHNETANATAGKRFALASFGELLARLGDRFKLIFALDDFQWANDESVELLIEIANNVAIQNLVFVIVSRAEDANNPSIVRLRQFLRGHQSVRHEQIEIGALDEKASRLLVKSRLKADFGADETVTRNLIKEGRGNPLFLGELCEYHKAGKKIGSAISLNSLIQERIQALPGNCQAILRLIALAGCPVNTKMLGESVKTSSVLEELRVLERSHLIRKSVDRETANVYHDRIRETIIQDLSAHEKLKIHATISSMLERAGNADSMLLATQYEAAGKTQKAIAAYCLAAESANQRFGFDEASRLYGRAIELHGDSPPQNYSDILVAQATAMANSGYGLKSARLFIDITDRMLVDQQTANELLQIAGLQLLTSGNTKLGIPVLKRVLANVGLSIPRFRFVALAKLLFYRWQNSRSRYRHLGPTDNHQQRQKREAVRVASKGLAMIYPEIAAMFQSLSLRLCSLSGSTNEFVDALALESIHVGATPGPWEAKAAGMLALAEDIARESNDPLTEGRVHFAYTLQRYLDLEHASSMRANAAAAKIFSTNSPQAVWELVTLRSFELWSMQHLGTFGTLIEKVKLLEQDAQRRQDYFALGNYAESICLKSLIEDDLPTAKQKLEQIQNRAPKEGYQPQSHNAANALIMLRLYEGKYQEAFEASEQDKFSMKKHGLYQFKELRVDCMKFGSLAMIGLFREGDQHSRKEVRRRIRQLQKEKTSFTNGLVHSLSAWEDLIAGRIDLFQKNIQEAVLAFEKEGHLVYAFSAKYMASEVLGDQDTNGWLESSVEWFTQTRVENPARFAAIYAPEFAIHIP